MLNRWQRTIVDLEGNVVPYAQLQIRVESTQAAAIIYADRAGTAPLPNGIVTANESGYAFFYAEADLYRISSMQPTIDWRHVPLGNASARDVGTSPGNVMVVGEFGLGSAYTDSLSDAHGAPATGVYHLYNSDNQPEGTQHNSILNVVAVRAGTERFASLFAMDSRYSPNTFYGKTKNAADEWEPWVEFLTTGNILQSTGNSTRYPMSQKAVTDALATKANVSNPGSMGIGVRQTWQDVSASRTYNTNYTNTTGRPISVSVNLPSYDTKVSLLVDGVEVDSNWESHKISGGVDFSMQAIVPAGSVYRVSGVPYNNSFNYWAELR